MKKFLFAVFFLLTVTGSSAQQKKSYRDSLMQFRQQYIRTHEVVPKADHKYFRFFPVNPAYRVFADFIKLEDTTTVKMKTSGQKIPVKFFTRYGLLRFTIKNQPVELTVYQSKTLVTDSLYKDYLFLPFTDSTTGKITYGSGRYLDLLITDIKDNRVELDFNKAYNPYCAYTTGYNCPVPPAANRLKTAIAAGEKIFAKIH